MLMYALLVMFGLFLGPSSWYLASDFQSEYHEFAQNAQEAPGIVLKRWNQQSGRSSTCYITVMYYKSPLDMTLASRIEVQHALEVEKGDKITVLYHSTRGDSDIRIKGETAWKNLPPILKPHAGLIYTLFTYLSLIFLIIRGKQKKKLLSKVSFVK